MNKDLVLIVMCYSKFGFNIKEFDIVANMQLVEDLKNILLSCTIDFRIQHIFNLLPSFFNLLDLTLALNIVDLFDYIQSI